MPRKLLIALAVLVGVFYQSNGQARVYTSDGIVTTYQWSPVFGEWQMVTVGTWSPMGAN